MLDRLDYFSIVGALADQIKHVGLVHAGVFELLVHYVKEDELEVFAKIVEEEKVLCLEPEVMADVVHAREILDDVTEPYQIPFDQGYEDAEEKPVYEGVILAQTHQPEVVFFLAFGKIVHQIVRL